MTGSEPSGWTIAIFFPKEADPEIVERYLSRISKMAYDYFPNREGWDPFVVQHSGDILHIDTDRHVYLSTGCYHGDHEYCQSNTGLNGQKTPASCKFCGARCECPCHRG